MTSIQENVYIDKLANRGNKYNNTYNSTIEMKPVDIRSRTYIILIIKILNLVTM